MPNSFPPPLPSPPPGRPIAYRSPGLPAGPMKDNRGVQAAKYSLYAPLVTFALNCLTSAAVRGGQNRGANNTTLDSYRTVGLIIGVLSLVLIVTALGAGIYALFSMRRFGSAGILGRAIAGVTISGLATLVWIIFGLSMLTRPNISKQVVGQWHLATSPKLTPDMNLDIGLNADGTYQFDIARGRGANVVRGKVSGHWSIVDGRIIGVVVDDVGPTGDKKQVGQRMLLGSVEQIDDHSMTLKMDDGIETYERR